MRTTDWEQQLKALREGKLRLEPPGESGLTEYASSSLFELRQYVEALEEGYRAASDRAFTLGCAGIAVIRDGLPASAAARIVSSMDDAINALPRTIAKTFYRSIQKFAERHPDRQQGRGRLWSNGACLGYAVMGLRQAGFSPQDAVCVLEAMQDAMEIYTLEQAAEAHQQILEDRLAGYAGRRDRECGSSDCAQGDEEKDKPEFVGPSAELLRREEEDGGK